MLRAFAGGLVLGVALFAAPASAQAPPARSDEPPPTTEPKPTPENTLDAAREESAFVRATLRYVRLMEFTERLQAEREQRDFEQAAARYAKFQEFTRKLEAQHEQELEREFNERVSLHVLKQAFTKELLERRQRASADAAGTRGPPLEKPVEPNPY